MNESSNMKRSSVLFAEARKLLEDWKGGSYVFGRGITPQLGSIAASRTNMRGKRALVVSNSLYVRGITDALKAGGIELAGNRVFPGARPNSPRADLYRIETYILHYRPGMIIAAGGGSTIDACKAANFLAVLGADVSPEIDHWFGTGIVSEALKNTGKKLYPLLAVMCSASSGSHLTKYANITDTSTGQKKLVVDESITPDFAFFDYDTSATMPLAVTVDGVLDAFSHCWEVFCGIVPDKFDLVSSITETALNLLLRYAPLIIRDSENMEAREALGLASDLGGYAIMAGGTGGAHLSSFSLVDLAGHGTACGLMNPYYTVFFSPAIERQLRLAGSIYRNHGYITEDLDRLKGRDLGLAVAGGMIAFAKAIGAPVTLKEIPGFDERYINKALEAAKDPQLEMKLKNMPIPLTAALVDEYMGPVLRAAVEGDFSHIRNAGV
ncbi:MAG: iron-containing alcohol dehydrogenase [Treponema sp.]|jgi:alcohol dehydrogenase class IV|nr:iron-containing alcohol dehydrogenase [Treponema sp.]